MKTTRYKVTVTNEILGNSERIMSLEQIRRFNICAKMCAEQAAKDGKPNSMGMWTVERFDGLEV